MESKKIINLDDEYGVHGIKVLSGRISGAEMRKKYDLDKLDNEIGVVKVVAVDFYAIAPSFFLSMFGPSVRKFGSDIFKQKYIFECDDVLKQNIEDGIIMALKTSNILEDYQNT